MLAWIRTKFGPVMVGGIIGFIAFVFVFYGVFNPKSTRGLHEGAVAGTVNGEPISLSEFNRELSRRMEFFKNMGGGKISEAQLKSFRIREGVFSELVNRKAMSLEAGKSGLGASDEEVRERIRQIQAFHKDGKFDTLTYRKVLEANNQSPAGFERMMREEVMLQGLGKYFHDRVRVSNEEVRKEYLVAHDKRTLKYVLLTTETARRGVLVEPGAIEKFLADPAKLNLAKSQYEARKGADLKGVSFDEAKQKIAHDVLAGEKPDELKKINEKLAGEIVALMGPDKASDAKVNALLKSYGNEVKSTGSISRESRYLPGVGEAPELMADAFAKKSPINPADGGKAKKYSSAMWQLVAVVTAAEKPDLAKLEAEHDTLLNQLTSKKERELYSTWMKDVLAHTKIEKNEAVVSDDGGGGASDGG